MVETCDLITAMEVNSKTNNNKLRTPISKRIFNLVQYIDAQTLRSTLTPGRKGSGAMHV